MHNNLSYEYDLFPSLIICKHRAGGVKLEFYSKDKSPLINLSSFSCKHLMLISTIPSLWFQVLSLLLFYYHSQLAANASTSLKPFSAHQQLLEVMPLGSS